MARPRGELKNTSYEIFIGALSALAIVNLVLVFVFLADPDLQLVLAVIDGLLSLIFFGDFLYRLKTAPARGRYFFRKFGWADLLSCIPFPVFKLLRVFRLVQVNQLLGKKGARGVWRTIIRDRANSALLVLLLMGILVLEFGSIGILAIEQYARGANITTASDALWFTMVTISTVGYGDKYPVTNAGRLVGTVIIIVGVGIFGTFTGYLANLFLAPRKSDAVVLGASPAPGSPSEPGPVSDDPGAAPPTPPG
ncbi:potassium channel family protein [Micromonospora sp. DT81.3]|uniref:potassium channel family protein n=1 Tax=Actinomycetes TaxID=1760 RepID=UPI003CE8C5FC